MIVAVGTTITRVGYVKPGSLVFNEGQTVAYVHTDTASVIRAPNSDAYPVQPASAIPWTGKAGYLYGVDPTGGAPGIGITTESGLPFPAPINSGPNFIIPELHSPNYVSGTSGWAIRKDGSVEFSSGTFRGNLVAGGLFLYVGAPGPGNNPVLAVVSPGVTQDPYGNPVTSVVMAGNFAAGNYTKVDTAGQILIFNAGGDEVILNASGLALLPSGAPASALVALSTVFVANDSLQLLSPAPTVAYTQGQILIIGKTGGKGTVQIPGTTNLQADGGTAVTGGLTADTAAIQSGVGGLGGLLKAINNQAAPANPVILFRGQAAGDRLFGIDVAGDTNRRFVISPGGVISAGPGNAGQDVTQYRAAANLWAMDYTAVDNSGVAEVWNAVTFAGTWANTGGANPPLTYRRIIVDNTIQWRGTITVPVGFTAPSNITTALPTSPQYRPSAGPYSVPAWNRTQSGFVRLQYGTGGILSVQAGSGAIIAGDILEIIPTLIPLAA